MKRLILLLLCVLAGCGAPLQAKKADGLSWQQRFDEALARNDGKAAAAAVASGHLDRTKAREAVFGRLAELVQEDYVTAAVSLAADYGLDKPETARFGQGLFAQLVKDDMCLRASEFVTAFDLGREYGEAAVQCIRKSSIIEAAEMVCDASVGDAYREALLEEAWASLESLAGSDLFSALASLVESSCPLTEKRAARWFAETLSDDDGLRLGRLILERAAVQGWGWDIRAMFRRLLAAAIGFDDDWDVAAIMDDEAFLAEDQDIATYVAYQLGHFRCEEAVGMVIRRKWPFARAEAIFAEPRCGGATMDGLSWSIKDSGEVQRWFALALRYGKFRLARQLVERLPDPDAALARVETAAFDAGDFDAVMDFPATMSESEHQRQERVLRAAMDRNDEWFVVRWNVYAQNQVALERRDGWVERAFLHALLRGDRKMAADCIARHSLVAVAAAGERLAFEEAMRAGDADTAIELTRAYKLDDDCGRRSALLKARQRQEAERLKAKKKKRPKAPHDWTP